MRKFLAPSLLSMLIFSGCNPAALMEPPMIEVMRGCDTGVKFSEYVSCIKTNYKRFPNRESVISFYAQLDAVTEDYKKGRLSETKAKAKAFELFDATIGAENTAIRNRPVTNTSVNVYDYSVDYD